MSVKSLRTGYKGISALAGNLPPGDFESISTVSLSSNQSTITFDNIASTWQHLQLRGIMRSNVASTGSDSGLLRLNNDNGSNYSAHRLYGTGSGSGSSDAFTSRTDMLVPVQVRSGNTASSFGVFIIDLLDYKNTNKYKTVRILCGADFNGSGDAWLVSGLWQNSAAVTRIDIIASNSGSFVSGSHFALYGIRG
jgi:hypothetical protein